MGVERSAEGEKGGGRGVSSYQWRVMVKWARVDVYGRIIGGEEGGGGQVVTCGG